MLLLDTCWAPSNFAKKIIIKWFIENYLDGTKGFSRKFSTDFTKAAVPHSAKLNCDFEGTFAFGL